jgi:hypothetical protein
MRSVAWQGVVEFRGRSLNRESLDLLPRPSYASKRQYLPECTI